MGHHRNPDGTLGVKGIPGHYTCEGMVRRWPRYWRRVQCHGPARHADEFDLSDMLGPDGTTITFRYCDACAPSYLTRSITPTTEEASP